MNDTYPVCKGMFTILASGRHPSLAEWLSELEFVGEIFQSLKICVTDDRKKDKVDIPYSGLNWFKQSAIEVYQGVKEQQKQEALGEFFSPAPSGCPFIYLKQS
jgi:hypothetical protein